MTTFSATEQRPAKKYIDMHTYGFGYIQNFRLVTPKKGKPFYSCKVRAFRGPRNKIKCTVFDTVITSKNAVELLKQCGDAATEKKGTRVLAAFTIGDAYPDTFPCDSGPNQKGVGCWEKGRLINIRMLKLDGNRIWPENSEHPVIDDTAVEKFEIITRGVGYANGFYTHISQDGELIRTCKIAAIHGSADKPDYTYFDTTVNDENIIGLLAQYNDAFKEKRKIVLAFTVKDLYPETFIYSSGEKQGETGCNSKGILNKISMIRIEGHQVYPEIHVAASEVAPQPQSAAA